MTEEQEFVEPDFPDITQSEYFRKQAQRQYESSVVLALFTWYRIPADKRREVEAAGGEASALTLAAFNYVFPGFPVHLVARKWPGIAKTCSLTDIFNGFLTRKFVREFEKEYQAAGCELPERFGLIFHYPYLRGGGEQASTKESPAKRKDIDKLGFVLRACCPSPSISGVRLVCETPTGVTLTLTPFSVFLREIAGDDDWLR